MADLSPQLACSGAAEVKNISSEQFTVRDPAVAWRTGGFHVPLPCSYSRLPAISQERICESTVSSSGRAIGSLAGAAVGQDGNNSDYSNFLLDSKA